MISQYRRTMGGLRAVLFRLSHGMAFRPYVTATRRLRSPGPIYRSPYPRALAVCAWPGKWHCRVIPRTISHPRQSRIARDLSRPPYRRPVCRSEFALHPHTRNFSPHVRRVSAFHPQGSGYGFCTTFKSHMRSIEFSSVSMIRLLRTFLVCSLFVPKIFFF